MRIDDDILRENEIAQRWRESSDQVEATADAVASDNPGLANEKEDLAEREDRLRRLNIDPEALVAEDDMVWLSFFSRGLIAARAVGRVVLTLRGEPPIAMGTGALIGPSLLITNNHVIHDEPEAAEMVVQFDYEYDDRGKPRPEVDCRLEPARFFHTDVRLDFTVVAVADLDGAPPGDRYGTVALIEETGKAVRAENLNVIHHPGGDRKRVSIRENRMVAQDDLWLRYTSDTKRGSSGAPVFNDQWEMVALHHGGVARRDEAGNKLTHGGEIWTEAMGAAAVEYVANEGARVSRIVRALRAAPLDPPARELIDRALTTGVS